MKNHLKSFCFLGYPIFMTFLMIIIGACSVQKNTSRSVNAWLSPNRYRIPLLVDQKNVRASNTPAGVEIDFTTLLQAQGKFDKHTVKVIAYNSSGAPVVFDSSRSGYEKYTLPLRVDESFGINTVMLNFVLPGDNLTYMAYFDTEE